jgi:NosR/NirI family nitrous oxide reductase transcriptional regulator
MRVNFEASSRRDRKLRSVLSALSCALYGAGVLLAAGASAQSVDPRLSADVLATVWPDAERIGAWEGVPPAAPVYQGEEVVGYIYSTLDVVKMRGYSNVPFDVIGGVDINGDLTASKVIAHNEPYIKNDRVRQGKIDAFLASHLGHKTRGANRSKLPPDFVSGATVSARSMRAATIESARFVLRGRSDRPVVTEPTLDVASFRPATLEEMLNDGSITHTAITNHALAVALAEDAGTGIEAFDQFGPADEPYLEIYAALATPTAIARNLIDVPKMKRFTAMWGEDGHQIFIAIKGDYDFRGTAWFKKANGHVLDRLSVVQGDKTIRFDRDHHAKISGARNKGLHVFDMLSFLHVPADTGFNPLQPWQFVLTVHHEDTSISADADFALTYQIPAKHVLLPEPEPVPAWVEAWQDERAEVGVMGAALATLTLILAFQTPLSRRRNLHRWVRNGFLLFVLVWVGWIAGAQLSIVNVFNYVTVPFSGFRWGAYLAEPLIFMIAAYTAVSLVLLGRGVFCGWLCPFGAIQELLGQIGRALRLPQWTPAPTTERWLRPLKYVLAVGLIGLAFYSIESATTMSEIEPFKTAITAGFSRAWPFAIYAAILLAMGLFVERFFCRYLCPLGGVLAILGRFHLFDNLKRRPQCGSPCHLCERSCAFNVIDAKGKINMNECFQCLDCQVEYHDDTRCPPLTWQRKRPTTATPAPDLPMAARGTVAGTPGTVAGTPGAVAGTPGAIAAT